MLEDVQRQMIAWSTIVEPEETIAHFEEEWGVDAGEGCASELLSGLWKDQVVEIAAEEATKAAEGIAEANA